MRLKGIIDPLITSDKFLSIESSIKNNKLIEIEGLSNSGKGYLISSIYNSLNKPMVIVTHSDMEAKNLYEDMNLYISNVYYLPVRDIVFYNIDAISGDLRWARLKVIKEIISRRKNIIITSIDAFAARYTPKDLYSKKSITLKVGEETDFNALVKILVEGGYERTEMVEGKGEF